MAHTREMTQCGVKSNKKEPIIVVREVQWQWETMTGKSLSISSNYCRLLGLLATANFYQWERRRRKRRGREGSLASRPNIETSTRIRLDPVRIESGRDS